eukprot:scaffold1311_cov256-Pinguiococcus_pyrenoidosus.AAC.10
MQTPYLGISLRDSSLLRRTRTCRPSRRPPRTRCRGCPRSPQSDCPETPPLGERPPRGRGRGSSAASRRRCTPRTRLRTRHSATRRHPSASQRARIPRHTPGRRSAPARRTAESRCDTACCASLISATGNAVDWSAGGTERKRHLGIPLQDAGPERQAHLDGTMPS